MNQFVTIALSFPTVVFSGLLLLAMLYWMIALLGLIEIDLFGLSLGGDGDAVDLGGFSGLLMKFGLDGVPLTVLLTGIALFGWVLAYFADLFWLQALGAGPLRMLAAAGVLLAALLLALPLTGLALAPMRRLFVRLKPVDSVSLLGRSAIVRSPQVTPSHGQASVDDGGAGLILQVRAEAGQFVRGDRVVLVDYLVRDNAYRVIADTVAATDAASISD